jgi:hypothetical protein
VSGSAVAIVGINRSSAPRAEMVPIPPTVPLKNGQALSDALGGPSLAATGDSLNLALDAMQAAVWVL